MSPYEYSFAVIWTPPTTHKVVSAIANNILRLIRLFMHVDTVLVVLSKEIANEPSLQPSLVTMKIIQYKRLLIIFASGFGKSALYFYNDAQQWNISFIWFRLEVYTCLIWPRPTGSHFNITESLFGSYMSNQFIDLPLQIVKYSSRDQISDLYHSPNEVSRSNFNKPILRIRAGKT